MCRPSLASQVPEPATLALLVLALGILSMCCRRALRPLSAR
ncbi:PEP-CTERM sorting domain-containing protein [Accumulibacter sp.]